MANCNTYCILDFGAKFDGTSDDTDAWNNALEEINAEGGGTLVLPAGTSKTTAPIRLYGNIAIQGQGREVRLPGPNFRIVTRIQNDVSDVFVLGLQQPVEPPAPVVANLVMRDLSIVASGGDVFVLGGHVQSSVWTHLRITQNNPAKRIFNATHASDASTSLMNSMWDHCVLVHLPNSTVSAFDVSGSRVLRSNTFSNLRCWNCGSQPFFNFQIPVAEHNSDCTMQQINFEICLGGLAHWGSATNWTIKGLVAFDPGTMTNDGFRLSAAPNSDQPCRNMTFIGCDRQGGSRPLEISDMNLVAGQALHTTLVNCYQNPQGVAVLVKANGNPLTWIGFEGHEMMTLDRLTGRTNAVLIGGTRPISPTERNSVVYAQQFVLTV